MAKKKRDKLRKKFWIWFLVIKGITLLIIFGLLAYAFILFRKNII